jgi:hypothetical protein
MNADREKLEAIRAKLEDCLELLPRTGAPSGIADHVSLAIHRLDAFLEMIDKWDQGHKN